MISPMRMSVLSGLSVVSFQRWARACRRNINTTPHPPIQGIRGGDESGPPMIGGPTELGVEGLELTYSGVRLHDAKHVAFGIAAVGEIADAGDRLFGSEDFA